MTQHDEAVSAEARSGNSVAMAVNGIALGVISSPYQDRLRNWVWKQWKYRDICKRLGRMNRYRPFRHALGLEIDIAAERGAVVFTNVGKNWVADKCRDAGAGAGLAASDEVPNKVGWGTGAGTAAATDTTLFTEATEARATAVLSGVTTTVTGDTLQGVGQITADGTKTITNAGWFTAASGADMILKGDFAGVPVVLSDAIEFTFKLAFG